MTKGERWSEEAPDDELRYEGAVTLQATLLVSLPASESAIERTLWSCCNASFPPLPRPFSPPYFRRLWPCAAAARFRSVLEDKWDKSLLPTQAEACRISLFLLLLKCGKVGDEWGGGGMGGAFSDGGSVHDVDDAAGRSAGFPCPLCIQPA